MDRPARGLGNSGVGAKGGKKQSPLGAGFVVRMKLDNCGNGIKKGESMFNEINNADKR